jgi:nucleoid-associated protein YgaU
MAENTPPQGASWDATQYDVVKAGDALSRLARRYYGDASPYPQILEANRDQLNDPDLIRVGQELRIP